MTQVASNNTPGLMKATHISPVDFSAAYTSASSITATGAPFTVDDSNCFVVYIMYKPSGGTWQPPIINGRESISASSNVITVTGMAPFVSGDTYIVGVAYQEKGYSSAEDSKQVSVGNQLNTEYTGETLASETDQTDGTYYYYTDMSGYRKTGFQLQGISAGSGHITITCEGTLQDDGTAAASCNYQDITSGVFTIASGIADDLWIDDAEKLACYKYVRLKVVADSGDNTCDYTIYSKKLY